MAYHFTLDKSTNICFLKHFGEYVGAEGITAALEIAEVADECTQILQDMREIESISMNDTDTAMMQIAKRKLANISQIHIVRLLNIENPVNEVIQNRTDVSSKNKLTANLEVVFCEADALRALQLPSDQQIP